MYEQSADSLRHYTAFMYGLVAISAACALVSALTMGWQSSYVLFVLAVCCLSFLFTLRLTQWIFSRDEKNVEMRRISEAIRQGSEGFLRVQYSSIATIALIIASALFVLYLFRVSPSAHVSSTTLAVLTAVSYLVGAFCSALAGYIGVWVSVRVNIRVSVAASKLNYADALLLAFRGGAVSACLSASLCILGLTVLYTLCHLLFSVWGTLPASQVPLLLAGYSFGGALVALFMQLGGGIYTKAADVGADMCGKIEAGIPEDDARNPAVIADLVGDNVGGQTVYTHTTTRRAYHGCWKRASRSESSPNLGVPTCCGCVAASVVLLQTVLAVWLMCSSPSLLRSSVQ